MAKSLEPQILVKTFLDVAHKAFDGTFGKLIPSDPSTQRTQNIIEYQGRMSATGMNKFNGPTHIAAVSFYSNEQDRDKHRAKGAIVIYLEASNTEKVLRAFGHTVGDDDEEEETLTACGKICVMLANKLKDSLGCSSLVISEPATGKNNVPEGVDFSGDQNQMQEFSFYFWKKKAMVVDITMADVPHR